jgi:hypothetical protein
MIASSSWAPLELGNALLAGSRLARARTDPRRERIDARLLHGKNFFGGLAQEGELYVLAQSRDRVAKERAMRRRQLKRLWARLKQLSTMQLTHEERGAP